MNLNNISMYVALTSTSQNLNAASKIDMVIPTTQEPDVFTSPMVPGFGKDYVIEVAPDFDEPFEFGN